MKSATAARASKKGVNGYNELRSLCLDNTVVSDAGLERLVGLSRLLWLGLTNTLVTDEGVKKFKQSLPNCMSNR